MAGGPDFLGRTFRLRAGRSLALGAFAMLAVAWIVSLPAVLGGLIGGAPFAWLLPRVRRLRLAVSLLVMGAVVCATAGSLAFGPGARSSRLVAALVASCAVVPWLVVVGFVRLHDAARPTAP